MTQEQVRFQRRVGYRNLRFAAPLEQAFHAGRARMMQERSRPVAISALILFLLYSLIDWYSLPASLSSQTVAVRLLVICPIILSVLAMSYRATPLFFARYYALSYLLGGLGLLFIILLSRRQNVAMPYDGVLLMLMFGFFVMGLPFRAVTLTSTLIVLLYITLEWGAGTDPRTVTFNSFFLVTAHLIGIVGAWLQEYQLRTHFLDRTQLSLSRSAAEAESARKTRFLAATGHDLRQPLNVVNLLLENLGATKEPAARRRIMGQLRQTVSHFNQLLGSLLDLSRLREGLVEPACTAIPVPATVAYVMESFREQARERGIRLVHEPIPAGLHVSADPVLFHRILQNLIGNALEHSGADTVRLEVAVQFDHVRLWVKDNGRGVSREDQVRLFDAFFRSANLQGPGAPAERGLGLGLAIVQQLAILMGGRCGYEPDEGRGSRFWIELNRACPAAPPPMIPESARSVSGKRLLLVEDDEPARAEVLALLRQWGFEASDFGSAEAALAAPGPYDLVVTDLHLPGLSGFELLGRLRAVRDDLPAVVLTADGSQRPRLDETGRTWVLAKPMRPGHLRAAVQRLLAGSVAPEAESIQ